MNEKKKIKYSDDRGGNDEKKIDEKKFIALLTHTED